MTAAYRLTGNSFVIRTADGACIPSDRGNRDWREYEAWLVAGNAPDPYVPPVPPPPTFLARDFFALLTVTDFAALRTAVRASDALGLLWASLQAQGDAPIHIASDRFLAGWAGLKQALPADRAAAIAAALGIPNS
jgi:hypothetical protein